VARENDYDYRPHPPTPLRLAEARRRGQVAHSADLASVLTVSAGVMLLGLVGWRLIGALTAMTASLLDVRQGGGASLAQTREVLWASLGPVLGAVGLLLGGMVAVAVLASFIQVGPLAAGEQIRPDFSRLAPSEGIRRLLSLRTCVRASLAVAKVAVVGAVGWAAIRSDLPRIVGASRLSPRQLAGEAGALAGALGLKIAAGLLVLGILDYLYQRWQLRRDLMMTRRELLADMRQMEGDPRMRARRKDLGRRRPQDENNG